MTARRCSELSSEAGESLAATATSAESWLLVEVPGSWPRDVSAEGSLAAAAHDVVTSWLERTPRSRLLFIRRPGRKSRRSLAFVIHASETTTEVRRLELSGAADLEDVDLACDGQRIDQAIVLVCGHGTRDACCALRGVAVHGALASALEDEELWISSHHGGHRFAANVLILPLGLHLGRLEPDAAAVVVRDALSGRIELERYRGRTSYPPPAQAAERVVRETLGLDRVADLHLAGIEGKVVRFRGPDGSEYDVVVEELVGPAVPASCGAEPEPQKGFGARMA